MRGMNGLQLCQEINHSRPETSVVVITAFGTMDTAIASIRAGAYDFVTKYRNPAPKGMSYKGVAPEPDVAI